MSQLFANPYLAVLALIVGFGFLIFVHELGHFLVAKWVGIRATQFAIGFGHALCSWRKGIGFKVGSTENEYFKRAAASLADKKSPPAGTDDHNKPQYTERQIHEAADALGLGETEYRLNWMPLGGYVKMLGQEDMDPTAASDDPRAFNSKSIGARAAVLSAGVVMNLIFGMVFLMLAFSSFAGVKFAAPYVGQTLQGSPAATTYADGHTDEPAYMGLRPGDHITAVNGKPIEDLVAVKIAGALGDPGQPVALTIARDGEAVPLTYHITPVADEQRADGMLAMGIAPDATLTLAPKISPAFWDQTLWAKAGVKPGMTLTAVDAAPVKQTAALRRAINVAAGKPVTLTFTDADTNPVDVQVTPQAIFPTGSLLGLFPATTVSSVADDSAAAKVGIEIGDTLARVGDALFPSVEEVIDAVQNAGSAPLVIEVLRSGERLTLEPATPVGGRLGIGLGPSVEADALRAVEPGSALADLNLPPGSRLATVNGQPVASFNALLSELQTLANATPDDEAATAELGFIVNLGAGETETTVLPFDAPTRAALAAADWALPAALPFEPHEVHVAGKTLGETASIGLTKTGEFIQQTYITLLRLFQGSVKVEHLRGPVGIVDAGATVAARGWPYYLFFLGLISINLAVINFLPIPVVDGGHIVFLIIEKFRGKPAGPAIQTAAMIVGLLLIASLFLVVTYNDIARIIG